MKNDKKNSELSELEAPVELADFPDYKNVTHIVFFIVYYFIYCLVWTLPQPAEIKIIVDLPLLFIVGFIYRKVLLRDAGVFVKHLGKYLMFVAFWFAIYVCFDALGETLNGLIVAGAAPNAAAIIPAFEKSKLLTFLCVVLCAPIMEELMFRRVFKLLFKERRLLYYLLSSLVFGFAHIVIDFSFPFSFLYIFSYVVSGLSLALIYDKSNNIICPIIVHLSLNLIIFVRLIFGGISF